MVLLLFSKAAHPGGQMIIVALGETGLLSDSSFGLSYGLSSIASATEEAASRRWACPP